MTAPLVTRVSRADAAAVGDAVRCLKAGGLVAFPTETVYGLGADATDGRAIARLYEAKGRPAFNPLIAHVADLAAARALARFDADAAKLAEAFWPGPLTLVLPKTAGCPVAELATAGLDSIAVRVPHHPVAQKILAAFERPIVAPSANRSGHVSPTTAAHVLADLRNRIDLIVDGGSTPVGVESTDRRLSRRADAAAARRPAARRHRARAGATAGRAARRHRAGGRCAARARHAGLALCAAHAVAARCRHVAAGEALLAFGPKLAAGSESAAIVLNLSERGDLIEAAANLFSHLRALDAAGAKSIAVMPIPHDGLGEAINDRLARAAAPR